MFRITKACNHALIHQTTQQDLWNAACRTLVMHCNYVSAWIQLVQPSGSTPSQPVAGFPQPLLESDVGFARSLSTPVDPIAAPHVFRCPSSNSPTQQSTEAAWAALISLPLRTRNGPVGILHVTSSNTHAFQPEETQSLQEAAHDLAMTTDALRRGLEKDAVEHDLKLSEERFRQLAENIHEVFWMTDPKKNQMLYISPSYKRVWGRDCATLYSDLGVWSQAIHEDDRERVAQNFLSAQASGNYDEIYRIIRPDGSLRWIRDRSFPVKDSSGQLYRLVGIAEDITPSQEALQKLLAEHNFYSAATDSLPGIFYVFDSHGNFLRWNDNFEKTTGYSRSEILKLKPTQLFQGPEVTSAAECLERVLNHGQSSMEANLVRKDGSSLPFYFTGKRFVVNGKLCVAGMGLETTNLKRAENALLKSEERFRLLVENSTELVCETNTDGQFCYASPNFLTLLGYSPSELIGQNIFLRVHPEEADEARAKFIQPFGTYQFRYQHKDGSWRWFESSAQTYQVSTGEWRKVIVSRDITQRRAVETILNKLSSALEQTDDNVFITDLNGTIEYVNPAFLRTTGYDKNELLGQTPRVLKSGQHPDAFYQNLWNSIRSGETFRDVLINRRKNGELYFEEKSITPIRNSSQQITHFVSVGKDITQRIGAEKAVRDAEARHRWLLETVNAIVWRGDAQALQFTYVSAEAEKLLGYPVEAWLEPGFWPAHLHPDDRETAIAFCLEATSKGRPHDFEYRMIAANGRVVWLHDIVQVVLENGKPKELAGVMVDITERKDSDRRICEQAHLLDLAHDAIFVCDLDHRITYWNHGAEQLLGWSPAEMLGACAANTLYKDPVSFQSASDNLIRNRTWRGEHQLQTKSGQTVIVSSRWTLVNDVKGLPQSILIINSDLTEMKRLESQFLRAQRLESLGTLAGGIAHDLNNILAPIMMAAQILRLKAPNAEFQRLIDLIEISGKRGADIVKQVLTFARGIEGERIPIAPRQLIRDLLKIIRETFPKSIEITADLADNGGAVIGDATQLQQVLLNLCVNARDAMPEGGRLSIRSTETLVESSNNSPLPDAHEGNYILIEISDTGTGIPPGVLQKIFDPFFTTKEIGKGTGLGLSTALGIVKSHNGFIHVYSEPGRGTAFKLYLPLLPQAAPESAPDSPPDLPPGNGELIMVVDDEASIRDVAREILLAYNYQVVTASNGTEATALFVQLQDKIKAVITDIMMPFMDGLALTSCLKKLSPTTPVIASSGMAQPEKESALKALGVQIFLTKPYTTRELLLQLQAALHP